MTANETRTETCESCDATFSVTLIKVGLIRNEQDPHKLERKSFLDFCPLCGEPTDFEHREEENGPQE